MIGVILKVAAYTYGPLLGLFGFGILTKRVVRDDLAPIVCIVAPLICLVLDIFQTIAFRRFRDRPGIADHQWRPHLYRSAADIKKSRSPGKLNTLLQRLEYRMPSLCTSPGSQ